MEAEVAEMVQVGHQTINHYPYLLEVAVHGYHPLFNGLYVLHPLLLFLLMLLMQLYIPVSNAYIIDA